MGVFAVKFLTFKLEYYRAATPDEIQSFETMESKGSVLLQVLTMPELFPLFDMLDVAVQTKEFQKKAQDDLKARPAPVNKPQDSTMQSKASEPKPRYQKLAEVPDEDTSEAEVLQTLEVIKNAQDINKDDAAMLLALKNNPGLKSKFLAHSKNQRTKGRE